MKRDTLDRKAIYAVHAHAQEVRLTAQHTRWQAARTRSTARLLCITPFMQEANRLTLSITRAILAQHGLLTDGDVHWAGLSSRAPGRNGGGRLSPRGPHPTHAPPGSALSA
jgi:hypothetical protein